MVAITDPVSYIEHEIRYATGVAFANTGRECRTSSAEDRARQTFLYQYDLDDVRTAAVSLQQESGLVGSVEVPLWHEEVIVDALSPPSPPALPAGVTFDPTDAIFINGVSATFADLSNEAFVRNLSIAPNYSITRRVSLSRFEGGDVAYSVNNGASVEIQGSLSVFEPLPDALGYHQQDGYPIILERPLHPGQFRKQTNQQVEVTDFRIGGVFATRTDLPESLLVNRLYFCASREGDREEWRRWKGFLNHIQGRLRAFLLPSFTRDITPTATLGTASIITSKESKDLPVGQYLRLQFVSGNSQMVQIESVTERATDLVIEFATSVTAGETIDYASIVKLSRLASDAIVIQHFSTYSVIAMTTQSLVADAPVIATSATGAGSEFDDSFDNSFA